MLLSILIALFAWLLSLFLPWWSVFIPGLFLGAALGRTGGTAFAWGFAGVGVLWLIQSIFIHFSSDGVLTTRIADLFNLPAPVLVLVATVLIGGLIGGTTALTGFLARNIFAANGR